MELDIELFYTEIQSFFGSKTVVIVGSGISCAEGLPGMWTIADELIKEMPKLIEREDYSTWEKIKQELVDESGELKDSANLEAALLKYAATPNIENEIKQLVANLIMSKEKDIINQVIVAERKLKFSEFIKRFTLSESGLVIITTNYDRLLEIACETQNIPVDNLFYGRNIAKFNEQKSKESFCERIETIRGKISKKVYTKKVLLLKPHGCLNWYRYNGEPISTAMDLQLERMIITPGTHKYLQGYHAPFDTHLAKANHHIDNASKFIILGYGFNDQHLETHLVQRIKLNIPTLIITMSLSENALRIIQGVTNVIVIISDGKNGTEIIFKNQRYHLESKCLWDIQKLVEEVFV